MEAPKKKQFSLSLIMRIFLGVLVLISIGVFASSVMYRNQLDAEVEMLQEELDALQELRADLEELMGSADEVNRLLDDLEACQAVLDSGAQESALLAEYLGRREEILAKLQTSKYKNYITRIARDELGLYFADEEIFYNDINQ